MAVLDAGLELSKQKCDTSNVGEMLFVADSSEVFVCDGKTWQTLKGADGKPGENGDNGNDGTDGDDGDDGKNCEVSREGNVLTIICANSTETINLDDIIQSSSSDEESSSSEEESSSSDVIASSSSANESSSSEEVSSSSEEYSSSEESSSSEEESSSSEEESSSSVVFPEGVMSAGYYENHCPAGHDCRDAAPSTYLKAGITYGEILDTRDDQVYKVVTIGDQTWMAQNLNYAPDENHVHSLGDYAWSGCYGCKADSCAKYGRLYTWEVAMDKAGCGYGEYCDNSGEGTQGICPSGWHLPSHGEFETLINYIDPDFGYGHIGDASSSTAGYYLKATGGWNGGGNSEDTHGFSALPGGSYYADDEYSGNVGNYAYFWSSTEYGSNYAYLLRLDYGNGSAYLRWDGKSDARSVRCLKD